VNLRFFKGTLKSISCTLTPLSTEVKKETDCEESDPPTSIVNNLMDLQKFYWSIIAKPKQGNVNDATKKVDQNTGL